MYMVNKYKYMCADLQEISFNSFKGLSGINLHHNQILETDLSAWICIYISDL